MPDLRFSVSEGTKREIAALKAYYGVTTTTEVLTMALADLKENRGNIPPHLRTGMPKLRLVLSSPPPEPEVLEPRP